MVHRYAALSLLAVLLSQAIGCRSLNDRSLLTPQQREPIAEAKPEFDPLPLIARHNQNARQVESFRDSELFVNIRTFTKPNGRERKLLFAGRTDGFIVMERPKNLRLVLKNNGLGSDLADIGANESGFWIGNGMQKEMIVGRYEELADHPLAATIQPEWIFEALGLQEIPEGIQHQLLKDGQTIAFVERREVGGESFRKLTYMNRTSGDVIMHILDTGDINEPIAQAKISKGYHEIHPAGVSGDGAPVRIPKEIDLNIPDVAQLTVTFIAPEINPEGIPRALVFSEPDKTRDGYARRDIREYLPAGSEYASSSGSEVSSSSRLYESLPSPPTSRASEIEQTRPISRREEFAATPVPETRSSAVDLLTNRNQNQAQRPAPEGNQAPLDRSNTRTSAVFESPIPRGPSPTATPRSWKAEGRFPREVMGFER